MTRGCRLQEGCRLRLVCLAGGFAWFVWCVLGVEMWRGMTLVFNNANSWLYIRKAACREVLNFGYRRMWFCKFYLDFNELYLILEECSILEG